MSTESRTPQQGNARHSPGGPLQSVDEWDDEVRQRYDKAQAPAPHIDPGDAPARERKFRDYEQGCPDRVRDFYRQNHWFQTVEFARSVREKYLPLRRKKMSVWQAIEKLNEIIDDSDPDTDLPQIVHALQTAEAIRDDGRPRWFILTGLIHDLGKVLTLFDEPQWAVVGDTFPVGCRFSDAIVFPEFFAGNPDATVPEYQTECGVYSEGCGLDNVLMSWGHDEYMYHVVKDHLPTEALAVIRYHSFYAWHREGAYQALTNEQDRDALDWVRAFNQYDLYTKNDAPVDVDSVMPFYRDLVEEFIPGDLLW